MENVGVGSWYEYFQNMLTVLWSASVLVFMVSCIYFSAKRFGKGNEPQEINGDWPHVRVISWAAIANLLLLAFTQIEPLLVGACEAVVIIYLMVFVQEIKSWLKNSPGWNWIHPKHELIEIGGSTSPPK